MEVNAEVSTSIVTRVHILSIGYMRLPSMLRSIKLSKPITAILAIDIVVTCFFIRQVSFLDIDWIWMPFIFILCLLVSHVVTFMVALALRLVFGKWDCLPLTFNLFMTALVIDFCCSYCMFTLAQDTGLMHVCLLQPFEARGKEYMLCLDETHYLPLFLTGNYALRNNNRYLIMSGQYFKYDRKAEAIICHDGPHLAEGRYAIINDNFFILRGRGADKAIISHDITPAHPYEFDVNGAPVPWAANYLCGFPNKSDTVKIDCLYSYARHM
jgi:hypothetical protein